MGLVYYNQEDIRWKNVMYSNHGDKTQTIGTSACGPTSAAMAISSLAVGRTVLPTEAAAYAVKNGFRTDDNGTAWGFFAKYAATFGLKVVQSGSHAEARKALADGALVVASMRNGHFTAGGHYILLVGIKGDLISVFDPNMDNKKYGADGLIVQGIKDDGRVEAKTSVFEKEASQYWIFTNPAAVAPAPASSSSTIYFGSTKIAEGKLINGSTYVPVRAVASAIGGTIGFEGGIATVNGKKLTTEIIGGSSYSPVREITNACGATITKATASEVHISK